MFRRILKLLGISILVFSALANVVFFGVLVYSHFTEPHFPVAYVPLCGVEDYINGNCIKDIKGWKQGESGNSLITENDWIIYTIRTGKQIENFGMPYSKKQLLDTAYEELNLMKNYNDGYEYKQEKIARIQSFIDIISKEP